MNVQERLISANKLLEWLDEKFRNYPRERMGDYGAGQDAIDMVAAAVESGTFDYTLTFSVGTIVRHKFNEKYGRIVAYSTETYDAVLVLMIGNPTPYYYRIDDLEPVTAEDALEHWLQQYTEMRDLKLIYREAAQKYLQKYREEKECLREAEGREQVLKEALENLLGVFTYATGWPSIIATDGFIHSLGERDAETVGDVEATIASLYPKEESA